MLPFAATTIPKVFYFQNKLFSPQLPDSTNIASKSMFLANFLCGGGTSGLWPGIEFIGHTVEGMKGKMLLLYTDGVTEAENMDQKQTGDDITLLCIRIT